MTSEALFLIQKFTAFKFASMMSSVALTDGLKLEIYFKFDINKFHTILHPEVLFIFILGNRKY
jgi:hypothetical protein